MQWNPRLVRAGLILWKRFDELNRPQVLFVEDALFVHTEVYRVLDRGPPVRSVAGGCYDGIVIDWSSCPAVERDPSNVSGAWVFRGTRVSKPVVEAVVRAVDAASEGSYPEVTIP